MRLHAAGGALGWRPHGPMPPAKACTPAQQQQQQPKRCCPPRPLRCGESRQRRASGVRCAALSLQHLSPQQLTGTPWAGDAAAAAVSLVGGVFLVKLFDFLQYSGALDKKVSRKLVHILAGPGLLLCWPLFSQAPYARFFAALVPSLNMMRLLLIGTGLVKDEGTVNAVSREGDRRELLRGPLFYVVVLVAATLLFWRESPVGLTAVALMCGGDGLADLLGRRFGAAKLPHNAAKSWVGSLAMWLGGWALAVAFIALFTRLGCFHCTPGAMAGSVGLIAFAAAVFESLPVNRWLDDNLSVPLLAALLGQCLFTRSVVLLPLA